MVINCWMEEPVGGCGSYEWAPSGDPHQCGPGLQGTNSITFMDVSNYQFKISQNKSKCVT